MKRIKTYHKTGAISFRKRLTAGLVVILLALTGVVYFFNKNNENFITTAEWTAHTSKVLYQSEQVVSLVKDVETATRGYLLSGDRRFLEPFFHGKSNIEPHIAALRSLTSDNAVQQSRIHNVSADIRKRIALSEKQIAIHYREGHVTEEIISLSKQGMVLMEEIRKAIAVLQSDEQKLLVQRREANEEAIVKTRELIYLVGLAMAIFLVIAWVVINRNFNARIRAEEQILKLNNSLEERIAERSEELTRAEHLLRHTLDNMVEGVQIIDFNWKYIYVNDALVKQFHYTYNKLIGHSIMDLYPGVELTELFRCLKQCMEERVPVSMETEFQFPDRSSEWFELSFQPVPDGIFILSTETTRQREAARLISEQKALAESLLLAAPDGIMGIDEQGRITMVNEQAKEMFLYDSQEIIGHHIGRLIPESGEDIYENIPDRLPEKAIVVKKEMTGLRKNGERFPVDISLSLLQTGASKTVIGSFRDITEKKSVEAELQNLTQNLEAMVKLRTAQLEEINKELDSFSYSVSHDLRAPLRAIDGYTKILLEEYGPQVDAHGNLMMETVRRNARRMGQLIDDLLAFSRLGKQHLVTTAVNMEQLVHGIIDELKGQQPRLQVVLHELPVASGDNSMLKQVVSNLVGNAVKYSSKKQNPCIEIGAYSEDGSDIYYVRDNGAGFDMAYADKLFGVFQRLHSTREFEGTGVGLAIVHRIIQRHGGRVWAEAREGEGAVFYFSLPKHK
ncbi:MAG: CHASE3 domain-containing protein [Chitinophagaceae bacterium]|nr:CHASE3 domain-containing protein [Chitinophagaceae bacterium]